MKIARPFALGTSPRIQSSSVMPVPLVALAAFHGARTPACLAGASSFGGGEDRLLHVGVVGEPGDGGVQRARAARDEHVGAAVVGREGLDPDRLREREDAVLGRADELAADLADVPAADRAVQRAPADAVARLEDDHLAVGGDEGAGGGEAGEPGADDADVGLSRAPARGLGGGGAAARAAPRRRPRSDELAAGESVVHGARA